MADIKFNKATALQTVINTDATLTNGTRAANDYNNGTALDLYCNVYLQVQYDGGPPAVGTKIADLWLLPGDGGGTEKFPDGGSAGVGTDDDPEVAFFVGSMESINPSVTVDELLSIPAVPLYPAGNRFVIKNTSGQTFDATWELRIRPYKLQAV